LQKRESISDGFYVTPAFSSDPSSFSKMEAKENTLTKSNSKQAADTVVQPASITDDDDAALRALGYVPSFKREFSNLSTVCFPSLFSLQYAYGCRST
jgi:hypothetical protein